MRLKNCGHQRAILEVLFLLVHFYNPPQKIRPEGATALRSNASPFRAGVPSGRIFWGGFERKLPKKIHNGSENSESQKK